tara:strand:- start:1085 stop:1417 length:333 start_codon:yes stop_codon:yes gene_type:complete
MGSQSLGDLFKHYLNPLADFQFTLNNPVFWLLLFILFLCLLRFWDIKKSLSFCLVSGSILLAATKVEEIFGNTIKASGEPFDPLIVRLVAMIFIAIVVLYYCFIKTESGY